MRNFLLHINFSFKKNFFRWPALLLLRGFRCVTHLCGLFATRQSETTNRDYLKTFKSISLSFFLFVILLIIKEFLTQKAQSVFTKSTKRTSFTHKFFICLISSLFFIP